MARKSLYVSKTGEKCLFGQEIALFDACETAFFWIKVPYLNEKVPFCFETSRKMFFLTRKCLFGRESVLLFWKHENKAFFRQDSALFATLKMRFSAIFKTKIPFLEENVPFCFENKEEMAISLGWKGPFLCISAFLLVNPRTYKGFHQAPNVQGGGQ